MSFPSRIKVYNKAFRKSEFAELHGSSAGMAQYKGLETGMVYVMSMNDALKSAVAV